MLTSFRMEWALRLGVVLLSLACLLSLSPMTSSAQVSQLTTLFAFPSPAGGAQPEAGVIQGSDGNFYGTTSTGGAYNDGTVFKLTSAGVETVLYSFQGGIDGAYPSASLVQGSDGNFYGTTPAGGANNAGIVFRITSDGSETVLHAFGSNSGDGTFPVAALIQSTDGNFYGTTSGGGVYGDGTVFQITPGGVETVLYSFGSKIGDGNYPNDLIQGSDGNFYGSTQYGGAYHSANAPSGFGTVFKLTPAGTESLLHSFSANETFPNCLIQGTDGNFYGTTVGAIGYLNLGNGTLFKLTPNGSETTLFTFYPIDPHPNGIIQGSDGNFYGTTQIAITSNNGIVFQITPSGTMNDLHTFYGSPDGDSPNGGLIQASNGILYGTSPGGGAYSIGAVFQVTTTGTESVLYSFRFSNGAIPQGSLLKASDGNFYGTTSNGGANNEGTVFKVSPAGTEAVLYSFQGGADGADPLAGLIQGSDGNFYGTTFSGGANNEGTVFKITPAGSETVLYSFGSNSQDGINPTTSLLQGSDGNFYGTTGQGGAHGIGTVYKITPAGAETVLYSFGTNNGDGSIPDSSLIQASDGNFYGTTIGGGTGHEGTVFKITLAGSETVLYAFGSNYQDGDIPNAVIQGSDGNFYGTTQYGGSDGIGIVFKITPSGSETILHSFPYQPAADGASPQAGLIQGSDGNLYGTTLGGGAFNHHGTIFKITPNGTETLLYSFTGGADGENPQFGLIQGASYGFYGTAQGGAYGNGTVFRLSLAPSDFNADGSSDLLLQNPSTGQLAVWFMNGVTPEDGAFIAPTQDPAWQVVGDGSFTANSSPDILFQNTSTGQLALWLMNGTTATDGLYLNSTLPAGWRVGGIADFDGDGSLDMLLQNPSTDQLAIWAMSGTTVTSQVVLTPSQAKGWTPVGTGDFNKDGHPDILFQNQTTGQLSVWYMNNNTVQGGAYITPIQQAGWQCVSVVDLNGDGWPDLVFQNTKTGQLVYWLMNGVYAASGHSFTVQPPAGWNVVGPH